MLPVVTVVGRMGRDLDLRFTPSGLAVANTSVAVNDRVKQPDGTWVDGDTTWFSVTLWRQLAENAVESGLAKGDLVAVVGRLKEEKWTGDDGVERTRINITADEFCPSLRYATAKVQRVQRTTGGEGFAAPDRTGPVQDDNPPF